SVGAGTDLAGFVDRQHPLAATVAMATVQITSIGSAGNPVEVPGGPLNTNVLNAHGTAVVVESAASCGLGLGSTRVVDVAGREDFQRAGRAQVSRNDQTAEDDVAALAAAGVDERLGFGLAGTEAGRE